MSDEAYSYADLLFEEARDASKFVALARSAYSCCLVTRMRGQVVRVRWSRGRAPTNEPDNEFLYRLVLDAKNYGCALAHVAELLYSDSSERLFLDVQRFLRVKSPGGDADRSGRKCPSTHDKTSESEGWGWISAFGFLLPREQREKYLGDLFEDIEELRNANTCHWKIRLFICWQMTVAFAQNFPRLWRWLIEVVLKVVF